MKIEMTGFNNAIITKRKRWAKVHRNYKGGYWRFDKNGEKLGPWMNIRLDFVAGGYARQKEKETKESAWEPINTLPEARLLK